MANKSKSKPEPPDHLSVRAKDLWRWVVSEYVIEGADLELLRLALEHADMADAARQAMAAAGVTVTDARGRAKAHAAWPVFRDSSIVFTRIMRELRLEPPAPESRPPRIGGE